MIVALFAVISVISEKYHTYMLNINYLLRIRICVSYLHKTEEEAKSSEWIKRMDLDSLLTCQATYTLPQTQNLEIPCSAAAYPWRHQKLRVFEFLLTETYTILTIC